MAFEAPLGHIGTQVAAADLSTKQYYVVKIDSAGKVALGAAVTDFAIGILQNEPTADQPAQVMVHGISKAVSGAAISAGDLVSMDANGKVITAVAGTRVLGQALAASAADGVIIPVLLHGLGSGIPTAAKTGWTAWTGTATRSTVAVGSATAADCAAAIKALLDDLIAQRILSA